MRRLIINADDFGLTSGVNRAIMQANEAGTVTSATLMATGTRFDEAVALTRSSDRLRVGCHVVLVDGTAVLNASSIPSLASSQVDGRATFYPSLSTFAARALAGRIEPAHVESEAAAQIRKLQANGIPVSHLDTHKHAHVFPAVLQGLVRAARACGVRAIRNPFVTRAVPLTELWRRPALAKRYAQVQALRLALAGKFHRSVEKAGLLAPDGSFGVIETGYMDRPLLDSILETLPEGTWELVCHPGYDDGELGQIHTRLRESRAQELQLLLAPGTRDRIRQRGIELISYQEFVSSGSR